MLRHCVMFQWNDGITDDTKAAIAAALDRLSMAMPGIVAYKHGPDIGVNDGNFDYAVSADFLSKDAYVVYRDHPLHLEILSALIKPNIKNRAAVQIDV